MRVPVSTPAGMLTDKERSFSVRPAPPQDLQGFLMVWPAPAQVGQVRSTVKKPCWARTLPMPEQVGQVTGSAPPSAPVPLHTSQPTELGTRYQPEELKQLCTVAKKHGMRVHMDGARFLLAVVSSGLSPKELSWKAGVDVLCLGGTKAGIGLSEAVVFFDPELAKEFDYRCKQAGQLASKMRYLTAPWISMLENSTYEKYLRSALELASFFAERAVKIPGVRLLHPVESNAVFLYLPDSMDLFLHQQGWKYYHFIGGGARFMCSWQTQKEDVQALLGDMTRYAAGLSQKSKSSEK